jgi:exodeoxyribonuclease-1
LGDADRRRLNHLRGLGGPELALARTGFDDERLAELLLRYRARNFPATLNAAEQAQWQAHRSARLMAGEGGALTLAALFDRVDALAETTEDEWPGRAGGPVRMGRAARAGHLICYK